MTEQAQREWAVAAVAAVGLAISTYLAAVKLAGGPALLCEAGGGCDIVQSSRYATFLGLPTAAWGAALYALVIGLALVGSTVRLWLAVFALTVAALAFSAYLTYLQIAVIGALCPWCIADAIVAVVLAAVVLVRRPQARRRQTQPRRLALIGGGVALATVIFAAGVFVAGVPSEQPAYREALARHLGATGAVFYGAYW